MTEAATTKLSTKGQVVIPEEIRARLGLEPGVQFVVVGDRDMVILKVLQAPDLAEFEDLANRARAATQRAGMKKRDVDAAIRSVRDRA